MSSAVSAMATCAEPCASCAGWSPWPCSAGLPSPAQGGASAAQLPACNSVRSEKGPSTCCQLGSGSLGVSVRPLGMLYKKDFWKPFI